MGRSITVGRRSVRSVTEEGLAATAAWQAAHPGELPPMPLYLARRAGFAAADLDELRRVAEEDAPDCGYGETWYRASDGTVCWVPADWTSIEEEEAARAAFLELDGVEDVIGDAEQGEPEGDGWERVYARRSRADLAATEEAVEEIQREREAELALATALSNAADVLGPAAALQGFDREGLTAALEALDRAHSRHTEGVTALVASAVKERGSSNGDALAAAAIDALRQHALRPVPAPAPVNVRVEQPSVHVGAPVVNVAVPEQAAPVVNVAASEAPVVNVTMPDAPAPAPIQVDVHVPELVAAAAPDVHVHVAAPEAPRPRAIKVEFDAQGNKRYVPENEVPGTDEA